MNIRTITVGAREEDLPRASEAARMARAQLQDAGYTVQTMRLALATVGSNRCADFVNVAQGAEELALDHGFEHVSIGRIDAERLPHVPDAIAATQIVSASARIVGLNGNIDPIAIRIAGEVIARIAATTPDGLGNMRFAASACVRAGSPFFPASYHDGGGPWLAIGPEAASLAVEATRAVDSPAAASARLTTLVEGHDQRIRAALAGIEQSQHVFVAGCDWSLAPRPGDDCSVGAAIEALSGVPFGAWGTLSAVRQLTEAIRAARVDTIGFSGVMLPVIEDSVLAQRSLEGRYTIRDLLAFSAVCGTGLDTIPLPGDTRPEQIALALSEVATLASALRKPLTARLLPLPGARAGELTQLNFTDSPEMTQFFCQARVLSLG